VDRIARIALPALAVAATILVVPAASAATTHHRHHHHHKTGATVRTAHILGHGVRIVEWAPGHARAQVTWGTRHTVPVWGHGAYAAINGGTFSFSTGLPVGLLRAGGRWIGRGGLDHPTVGFLASGGLVFGARAAIHAGAENIIAGPAYLIWEGHVTSAKRDAPFASGPQYSCGPRGTDGRGCFRSCVVRFGNGNAGLVEVGYATMPQAARVLHRLGVVDALTLDSGGSANEWVRGHGSYGITEASGMRWQRRVPDAIVVS
jgi:exopolysaccharide biosynthesis protein